MCLTFSLLCAFWKEYIQSIGPGYCKQICAFPFTFAYAFPFTFTLVCVFPSALVFEFVLLPWSLSFPLPRSLPLHMPLPIKINRTLSLLTLTVPLHSQTCFFQPIIHQAARIQMTQVLPLS